MTKTDWNTATDAADHPTREFRIHRSEHRDITGALWLPPSPATQRVLVCFGHGASGNRYQAPISYLAGRFANEAGLPALSLDGPVHGLRQVGEGGRKAFFPEYRRETAISEMIEEWHIAIKVVSDLPEIDVDGLAYFGLSMGSIFGVPLVASRDDVVVATLGLLGVNEGAPHEQELMEAAQKIACPLFFMMQLEDELFSREGYLRLFDAFPSKDKRIHANPGLHPEIPAEEIDFAFNFLKDHIQGQRQRRIVNPLAE